MIVDNVRVFHVWQVFQSSVCFTTFETCWRQDSDNSGDCPLGFPHLKTTNTLIVRLAQSDWGGKVESEQQKVKNDLW